MSKKQSSINQKQKGKYQEGSGSKYHREHSSQVQGYGGNNRGPNEKS